MQNSIMRFTDLEDLVPGQSKIYSEAMGMMTYVGTSDEGDAVVQKKDHFTSLPEVSFNLMAFQRPFEQEMHIRYIKEDDLAKIHKGENIFHIDLNNEANLVYQYEVAINVKKVYDVLGANNV